MKKIVIYFCCICVVFSLCACTAPTNTTEKPLVALIPNGGNIHDNSYNELVWSGLQSMSDSVSILAVESVEKEEFEQKLTEVVNQNPDLVWITRIDSPQAVADAAYAHPDITFIVLDAEIENMPPNLSAVSFKGWEGAFVAGYIAGKTTQTGRVGFIGGEHISVIEEFEYGFRGGVAYAAKVTSREISVETSYTGTFSNEGNIGKLEAEKQYANGCDIIFQAAGSCGLGVIEAAKEQNLFVIGVDEDQSALAPDNVLTSVTKDAGKAVIIQTGRFLKGEVVGGENYQYGIRENAVGIAKTRDNIGTPVYTEALDIQAQIIDGLIVPPYDAQTYQEFIENL